MNTIVTPYEYITYFGLSSYNINQIESLLNYTTDMIETYCDRNFEKTDYTEWYDGVENNIQLENYPINRLYFVKPSKTIATFTTTNTAIEQYIEKDYDNVYITLDNTSSTYPLSTYTTIGSLSTELAPSGINIVLSDITATYPTTYIKDFTDNLDNSYMIGADIDNIRASIDKHLQRFIKLENASTEVLVKYNAGYTFSQDTSGHDALSVTGNVPNDLKNVCFNLAHDINLATNVSYNAAGTPTTLFKSENIGDYSYSRFDNTNVEYTLSKYAGNNANNYISTLEFYRKKSFG
jgi:hypothetical protein